MVWLSLIPRFIFAGYDSKAPPMPVTPDPPSPVGLPAAAVPERRPLSADADLFGLSDRGQVRKENQDQFMIASLHKLLRVHQSSLPADDITPLISDSRGFLFLVADGVGGRPDGLAASGTAVRTIAHYVTHLTDLYRRLDPAKESVFMAELQHSVERTHEVLRQESKREYGGRGGATTLTMVAVLWPRAYLVQVGDSRCYRLRDGQLELMSRDQTVAQQLVDSGALSLTEARRSPFHGVLASALGGREATPITRSTEIRWDDVMLLCTDGLTKHVSDEEIEAELRHIRSAEESCRTLIKLALDRGGSDNVTVVIGRLKRR
jgi:serine/threonine protein phosphatase PrpC